MRRIIVFLAIATLVASVATPASATHRYRLDGPSPAIWLSDPDGIDGVNGIEAGSTVEGSSGWAVVNNDRARIKVKAKGLEPGHAYTMWVVYFNDQTLCVDGCNGQDLATGGGVIYGSGRIANHQGTATFRTNLRTGDGAAYVGESPPPPFATAAFAAGGNNEFHIVIRSHGPLVWGQVWDQLTTYDGGCIAPDVGPGPEQPGDFPVPLAPGECGDVQLFVFK